MKKNTLFRAGTLYFIGNIFDKAIAFITVPIFTRLLSTSEYGITTTYLSWVSILTVVITLSLGNSIRTAIVDFDTDKDGYMSSIFTLGTLSAISMSAVLIVVSRFNFSSSTFYLTILCCIQAYSASIIQSVQWRNMMDLQYVKRTFLQCVPNLLGIVLSIIFIRQMDTDKYFGRIIPYAFVMLIFALIYLLVYFRRGKKFVFIKYWKYALAFSLPIIFHSLSTVILSQADRTMLTWLRSSSETGIYGLAYQFGMVPLVFTTTFENIWIPWFTKKMEESDKNSINKMVIPYITIIAIMCSGIMLVAPEVLKFMTTPDYYSAIYVIPPVVAATFLMFLASVPLDLEYYLKKTKSIAINTVIAAIVNIILNYIFIPKFGATAAGYTTVASYAVSFLMHYFVARKMDTDLFGFKIYIIPLAIVAVFTIVSILLMDYALIRWGIGVVLGAVFIFLALKFIKKQRT